MISKNEDEKTDAIIKKMLETPPKPNKPLKDQELAKGQNDSSSGAS